MGDIKQFNIKVTKERKGKTIFEDIKTNNFPKGMRDKMPQIEEFWKSLRKLHLPHTFLDML